jgi:Tfp pilus assembly protein PilX
VNRAGFALAAALLTVLLVAALICAVSFAATEETRTEAALGRRDRALTAAESAIAITMSRMQQWTSATIGVGETSATPLSIQNLPLVVYITRLDSTLYWLVADATDGVSNPGAGRRIGLLVRATKSASDSISIDPISVRGWSELF